MSFIGEIVEREVSAPEPPSFSAASTASGFPKIAKRKPSQWRSRLQEKGMSSMSNSLKAKQTIDNKEYVHEKDGLRKFVKESDRKLNYEGLSEAERIHQENIELLSRMSVDEREEAKEELLGSLDPEILQMLLNRSTKRSGPSALPPAEEETGEWYGSSKENNWGKAMDEESVNRALGINSDNVLDKEMPGHEKTQSNKKVNFKEDLEEFSDHAQGEAEDEEEGDVDYLNGLAPTAEQINRIESEVTNEMITNVHFPRPPVQPEPEDYKIDLNDPDFNEKLHEKYFPDLPRDTENLKWMEPVANTEIPDIVESIKDLRFDFKGNLILPEESTDVPTYLGLHHHADQPQLPGYTLSELSHYARSTFNSQRCIAIQTLGRILHKLGLKKYNFQRVDEEGEEVEGEDDEGLTNKLWDLVNELKILDTLKEFSDENLERNLSVRNYCIEAIWLWRKGGGDKRKKENAPEISK